MLSYDPEDDLGEMSREEIVEALKLVQEGREKVRLNESERGHDEELKELSDSIGQKNRTLDNEVREAERQVLKECLCPSLH